MANSRAPTIQRADERRASERVLEAVGRETGTDPLEFDALLSDVVDPDALDALFDGPPGACRVQFSYAGCDVVVESDGSIDVTPGTDR